MISEAEMRPSSKYKQKDGENKNHQTYPKHVSLTVLVRFPQIFQSLRIIITHRAFSHRPHSPSPFPRFDEPAPPCRADPQRSS